MASKLIQLTDDTLVEVEVTEEKATEISGGLAGRVKTSFNDITPILKTICRPITETWTELSRDFHIQTAEIELGLSFEGEGNLYITKAKTGANLKIKLIMKPKE